MNFAQSRWDWLVRKMKKVDRVSFPTSRTEVSLYFLVEGQQFEYRVRIRSLDGRKSITLEGGDHKAVGGLYVNMSMSDGGWFIRLHLKRSVEDVLYSSYRVKHFEELPTEVFVLVSHLAKACWDEYRGAPERAVKQEEEDRQGVLDQFAGAKAMISPNPLIRLVAQKSWKK